MATKRSTKKISLDGQKISVNCIDFDIKVSKPDFKTASMCEEYGLFEKRLNRITIQDGLAPLSQCNTVIHELFHSYCYLSTLTCEGQILDSEEKEEMVVNTLTNYFIGTLKQNKWFRDYLIQCFDTYDNNK